MSACLPSLRLPNSPVKSPSCLPMMLLISAQDFIKMFYVAFVRHITQNYNRSVLQISTLWFAFLGRQSVPKQWRPWNINDNCEESTVHFPTQDHTKEPLWLKRTKHEFIPAGTSDIYCRRAPSAQKFPNFLHKTATYHKECLQISTYSRENTVTFHVLLYYI